jgi:hypothetical protein
MPEAYMVGMVVPQEQAEEEEDGASNDSEALYGGTDDDVIVPATINKQVALLALFKTAHREEVTRKFMAAKREALAAMLAVRANMAREAVQATVEELGCGAGGHTWQRRQRHRLRRRSRRRWQRRQLRGRKWPGTGHVGTSTLATTRRNREMRELTAERHHRIHRACRHADGEGSNAERQLGLALVWAGFRMHSLAGRAKAPPYRQWACKHGTGRYMPVAPLSRPRA